MKYIVSLFYDATIRDDWEVEAEDKEDAIRKAKEGGGEQIRNRTIDSELVMEVAEELDG